MFVRGVMDFLFRKRSSRNKKGFAKKLHMRTVKFKPSSLPMIPQSPEHF